MFNKFSHQANINPIGSVILTMPSPSVLAERNKRKYQVLWLILFISTVSTAATIAIRRYNYLSFNSTSSSSISMPVFIDSVNETKLLDSNKLNPITEEKYALKGNVYTSVNYKVDGAYIILSKNNEQVAVTYTDDKGDFVFDDIVSGTYSVRIIRLGFKDIKLKNVKVISPKSKVLKVKLVTACYVF